MSDSYNERLKALSQQFHAETKTARHEELGDIKSPTTPGLTLFEYTPGSTVKDPAKARVLVEELKHEIQQLVDNSEIGKANDGTKVIRINPAESSELKRKYESRFHDVGVDFAVLYTTQENVTQLRREYDLNEELLRKNKNSFDSRTLESHKREPRLIESFAERALEAEQQFLGNFEEKAKQNSPQQVPDGMIVPKPINTPATVPPAGASRTK